MYLFACVFFLVKCLFRSFTRFFFYVGLSVFLLSWESHLHILISSPLSGTYLQNFLPVHEACLFIFLIMSFKEQKFLF